MAGEGPRGSADRVLPAMKRLIDDGYALPFAAAMALERERSQAHRARVTGEAVAGHVDAVVARGKAQSLTRWSADPAAAPMAAGGTRRPWPTASIRRPVRR